MVELELFQCAERTVSYLHQVHPLLGARPVVDQLGLAVVP
jgi:hypothetical protein